MKGREKERDVKCLGEKILGVVTWQDVIGICWSIDKITFNHLKNKHANK